MVFFQSRSPRAHASGGPSRCQGRDASAAHRTATLAQMTRAASAPADPRPNLYGMSRSELESLLEAQGAPRYHGDQVFRWLYARRRFDPASFTDLPKAMRAQLGRSARVDPPKIATRIVAEDGTVKYGVSLPGGGTVETVCMKQRDRITLCASSQVGCALMCGF